MLAPHAGLVACLFWNIIATTTAWIKGEGATKVCLNWHLIYLLSSAHVTLLTLQVQTNMTYLFQKVLWSGCLPLSTSYLVRLGLMCYGIDLFIMQWGCYMHLSLNTIQFFHHFNVPYNHVLFCLNICFRTESALKFGWFFLFYMVRMQDVE